MDYKILQPNFDPASLDSWEEEVPDYCTHFYVFSPVLQSKNPNIFFGWRWNQLLLYSKINWDNRRDFDLIGTFPVKWHFCIGGNYFCQCNLKSIFKHWFNNEK